jgi:hypothetical protein
MVERDDQHIRFCFSHKGKRGVLAGYFIRYDRDTKVLTLRLAKKMEGAILTTSATCANLIWFEGMTERDRDTIKDPLIQEGIWSSFQDLLDAGLKYPASGHGAEITKLDLIPRIMFFSWENPLGHQTEKEPTNAVKTAEVVAEH